MARQRTGRRISPLSCFGRLPCFGRKIAELCLVKNKPGSSPSFNSARTYFDAALSAGGFSHRQAVKKI
jgi:hypothetical protein